MLPGHLKAEEWSFLVLWGLKGYRAEKPQGDRYCLPYKEDFLAGRLSNQEMICHGRWYVHQPSREITLY